MTRNKVDDLLHEIKPRSSKSHTPITDCLVYVECDSNTCIFCRTNNIIKSDSQTWTSLKIYINFYLSRFVLLGSFTLQAKYVSSKSVTQARLRFVSKMWLTPDQKVYNLEHKLSITINCLRRCTCLLVNFCFAIGQLNAFSQVWVDRTWRRTLTPLKKTRSWS